jgi:hypothetical protein
LDVVAAGAEVDDLRAGRTVRLDAGGERLGACPEATNDRVGFDFVVPVVAFEHLHEPLAHSPSLATLAGCPTSGYNLLRGLVGSKKTATIVREGSRGLDRAPA